jgi:hypothetical protein
MSSLVKSPTANRGSRLLSNAGGSALQYMLALLAACSAIMAIGTQSSLASGEPRSGRTLNATPADYRAVVATLKPGDRLVLAPGEYRNGLPIRGLGGTARQPIVIEGATQAPRPLLIGRRGANTISIVDARHVIIRNLKLDGRGLAVDAVKVEARSRYSDFITVEGLEIVGHGHDQQIVGISVQRPARGWIIRRNVIIGAGTGMYLGSSDGTEPFVEGLIEGNLVRDTIGYNLEIKHQKHRDNLVSGPTSSSVTIIRDNVFSKAKHASGGELARPNVLVGHFPPAGPGKDDVYLIYRNFFYENPSEALFQGEGNIALYDNVFLTRSGDAIHIQPHNAVPRAVDIFYNTVIASGVGIRVRAGDPSTQRRVFANAVFAAQPIEGGDQAHNATGTLHDADRYLLDPLSSIDEIDLRPRAHSMPKLNGILQIPETYVDARKDFDRHERILDIPGAYASAGPTWTLGLSLKPLSSGGSMVPR